MDISSLVGHRYHILNSLGGGVHGKVYKVVDRTNEKVLALKIVPEEYGFRLRREFSFLSQLDHPNIVQVFDLGSIPQYSYFTMEFVDGSPINQALKGYSKEFIEILFQICEALHSIHSQGLLHADLKPENILLKKDSSVKLLDLGFADDYSTISNIPRGSLGYIAPEVFKGVGADARTDLYSLGVIAYEVLTNKRPFEGEDVLSQLRSQYYSELPPPGSLKPEIPEELNGLVFSLVQKEPDRRPCSAIEVMERLKDFFSLSFSLPSLKKPKRFLLSSPLIGRGEILKKLKRNWEKGGKVTFITGETGMGKSRLLREFKFLTQIEGSLALSYSPREFGKDLLTWLTAQIPDFNPPKADELPETEAKEKRYQLFEAFTEEFLNFWKGSYKSLVLLLDDLELFDPSSFDLLRYISLSINKKPVVLVSAGLLSSEVTDFIQELSEKSWVSHLKLPSLTSKQTQEFVLSLLGRVDKVEELGEWLYEKTGGIPLFLFQTVHSLIDQEILSYLKGMWMLSQEVEKFHLPKKTEDMVMERLGVLLPEEEEVLKIASVIGRSFELPLLSSIYSDRLPFDAVESLISKGFLNVISKVKRREYVVSNRILSEIIEKRMEPKESKEVHKRVAEAVESLYPDEEFVYDLAHYYIQAKIKEKAYHYSIRAGGMAKRNYLTEKTLGYYKNALMQKTATSYEKVEILKEIGDLQSILGRFSEAIEFYSRAVEISEEKYKDTLPLLLCKLGTVYQMQKDYGKAMREFERAKDLLPPKPSEIEAEILERMGWCYLSQRDYDRAEEFFSKVLRMGEGMRNSRMKANALYNLGVAAWHKKDFASGLKFAEKSLSLYRRLSKLYHTALVHSLLGSLWWEKGNMEQAKKYYEKTLSLQRKSKSFYYLLSTLNNLGLVVQAQSEFDEARRYFEESLLLTERIGDKETEVRVTNNLGTIFQEEGNWEKAHQYFSKGLRLAKKLGYKKGIATSLSNLGSLLTAQGDIDQAQKSLEQALKIGEELKDETLLFFLHHHFAQFYLR